MKKEKGKGNQTGWGGNLLIEGKNLLGFLEVGEMRIQTIVLKKNGNFIAT